MKKGSDTNLNLTCAQKSTIPPHSVGWVKCRYPKGVGSNQDTWAVGGMTGSYPGQYGAVQALYCGRPAEIAVGNDTSITLTLEEGENMGQITVVKSKRSHRESNQKQVKSRRCWPACACTAFVPPTPPLWQPPRVSPTSRSRPLPRYLSLSGARW